MNLNCIKWLWFLFKHLLSSDKIKIDKYSYNFMIRQVHACPQWMSLQTFSPFWNITKGASNVWHRLFFACGYCSPKRSKLYPKAVLFSNTCNYLISTENKYSSSLNDSNRPFPYITDVSMTNLEIKVKNPNRWIHTKSTCLFTSF